MWGSPGWYTLNQALPFQSTQSSVVNVLATDKHSHTTPTRLVMIAASSAASSVFFTSFSLNPLH